VSLRLRPGSLWPAVDARTRSALACGALQPITTRREWVEEGGVRFLVHVLGGESRKRSHAAAQRREGIDPFAAPEPELFVADVSDTHYCVLNKFPILPRHALVVTRAFEEQEAYLGEADFEALAACLAEGPAFVAYNAGPGAGASQRHKHLQLVPAPLGEGPALLATEPWLEAGRLPFRCVAERVDGLGPAALHARYRAALASLYLAGDAAPTGPYNLVATPRWLLVVPRRRAHFEGAPVNALAFAGALLAFDDLQLARIRTAGPLAVLAGTVLRNQETTPAGRVT
jgi:ATP adenylyltransferase